jgi:ABC-type branched-subunit amino acid transport system substrate-binding protein
MRAWRVASLAMLVGSAALSGCTSGGNKPSTSAPPVAPPPIAAAPLAPPPGNFTPPSPDGKIRVALLLPLSGDAKDIGQGMLDAAQLALFDVADDPFVLVPRDTGTSPEDADRAAQSAISEGARLIIGPLFAADAPVVAQRARAAGVNMVSLSNDRTIAAPDLFILGLTPQS